MTPHNAGPPPGKPFSPARDAARLLRFTHTTIFAMICHGDLAQAQPGRARRVVIKSLLHHTGHHSNGTTPDAG